MVQFLDSEWPASGQDYIEDGLDFGKLFSDEKSLAEPQVQAVESARDVTDFTKHDKVFHHAIQHALKVEETATAFDVELIEHLGCFLGQVLPQGLLLVQPVENVLLHILDDVGLAQIIQADFAESYKKGNGYKMSLVA